MNLQGPNEIPRAVKELPAPRPESPIAIPMKIGATSIFASPPRDAIGTAPIFIGVVFFQPKALQ